MVHAIGAKPEAARSGAVKTHSSAYAGTVAKATDVAQVARMPVARLSVHKDRGVKQRCPAT